MVTKKTILCVDDDRVSRLYIKKFIEHHGAYHSAEASCGKSCLDLVRQIKVDLIILDYNLGDINGQDVCRKIPSHSLNPEVPIIICSMLDSHDIKKQCDFSNVKKIVQKPYDIEHLQQDIEEILEA